MPTKRIPLRREHRGKLTLFEEQELWLGVCNYPAFADDDERRATWERHRTRIMDTFAHAGHRPAAWWAYDAPEGLAFNYDRERSILYEADLLEADERVELITYWRAEFERANTPGFAYCTGEFDPKGQAVWLTGREARMAHHRWADIPESLIAKWEADDHGGST